MPRGRPARPSTRRAATSWPSRTGSAGGADAARRKLEPALETAREVRGGPTA